MFMKNWEEGLTVRDQIERLRREYCGAQLDETTADEDPINLFGRWMEEALKAEVPDPHAMVLATATTSGKPSARVVLLRGFDRNGFVFYTNYRSRKGKELQANPKAAAVFLWHELDRQVRIEGTVEKAGVEESDWYFDSRPRESQLAAWASNQSDIIHDRRQLDSDFDEFKEKFSGAKVVRPEFWGGFRIKPESFEFWQGRPRRLHDRLLYVSNAVHGWEIHRLAP